MSNIARILVQALIDELDEDDLDHLAEQLAPFLKDRLVVPTPDLLDSESAARYLSCGRDRIHDLVGVGKLTPLRDGRRLLFRREDLQAYLSIEASGMSSKHLEELREAFEPVEDEPPGSGPYGF